MKKNNKLLTPINTPLIKIFDNNNNIIYLKDETKQYTNAFKYRGVYNKFKHTDFSNYDGIIAASTGNHGQAVSLVANQINMECFIIVPFNTPKNKVDKIKNNEATVISNKFLVDYYSCAEYAKNMAIKNNLIYIASFDDMDIISGHMKLFEEIDINDLDYCFCPVGGGGLISAALKSYNLSFTNIVGVELERNDAMNQSLKTKSKNIINIDSGDCTFCEGILVSEVGDINYSVAIENNLKIKTVSINNIKEAIRLLSRYNIKTEGAGAASVAGYLNSDLANSKILCIISGGNIDNDIFEDIVGGKQ